ncbi:hypothetical protein I6M53_14895 [Shewanella algae]|uniref:hypothetical protein n=1 Tax=Shewanella algae TaxID=38313 RepID=UPI001AACD758|nr:hypothetical protein [Shewanella algae]MBO2675926.1 hypothetical protein [Shewanella algae]
MLDNSLAGYDFDNSQSIRRQAEDSVSAINIRLDADKLLAIPFCQTTDVRSQRHEIYLHSA